MAAGCVVSLAFIALSLLLSITFLSANSPTRGFTLSLIPRDSLNIPLSNEDDNSRFTQIRTAITRSIARAKRISTFGHKLNSASDSESDIINADGEYLMNISIGKPPFPILAIADTGSDLVWTQCKPCSNCYDQKAPLFDSTKSCTYRPIKCSAPQCTTFSTAFDPACDSHNECQYSVTYGDMSTSSGAIATETFTLGSSKFRKVLFGCGFYNRGTFDASGSGIIGLGNGQYSLIGQLHKFIGGKFSYCLVPLSSKGTKSSDINFGQNANVSGHDVVSTPLVTAKDPSLAIFYWLTLEAITIGQVRVPYTNPAAAAADGKGNTIIDSGTTLLILPQEFYNAVEAVVAKYSEGKRVGTTQTLTLCYDATSFKAPDIVVNFEGADLKLNDFNAFVMVAENVVCFAAAPSDMTVYGNLAQTNFLVGYDKVEKRVSFKPMDCSRHSS